MKHWWSSLAQRERWILGAGMAISIVLLGYVLLWEPWQAHYQRLQSTVLAQRADLAWMRQAAQDIQRLSANAAQVQSDNRSLLTRVDASARAAGLGTALKNSNPQGIGKLSVRLEQAEFQQLLTWLYQLEREHAVRLSHLSVERSASAGRVNVRVVFEEEQR